MTSVVWDDTGESDDTWDGCNEPITYTERDGPNLYNWTIRWNGYQFYVTSTLSRDSYIGERPSLVVWPT